MKKLLLILPLLVIFFASCEKDNIWKPDVENPGDGKETGKVTLSVKQEGAFTVVTKSEDAVAVADLRIRIWKGDVIVKEYAKYSQAPNVVELEPGDYTLEAGTTGDKEAAWAQPIYNGKKDFTIESGKVTSANVVCKLTNMKVTIKDVAKAAGVSPSTVSRALHDNPRISEEMRKQIKKIAQEMDFHPNQMARSLVSRRSRIIGVVFSGIFMAMLDIVGQNLTGFTAYNEYITDVIIAVIVYLSAFSLVIQTMLPKIKKANAANANAEPAPVKEEKEGGESV